MTSNGLERRYFAYYFGSFRIELRQSNVILTDSKTKL